jgi:hypothetical protein
LIATFLSLFTEGQNCCILAPNTHEL